MGGRAVGFLSTTILREDIVVRTLLATLVVAMASAVAMGQPLSERVPGDAVVYVGWQGSGAMPAAYANSHLKAVLEASTLPEVFSEYLPRLTQRIAREQPMAAGPMQVVTAIGARLWRYPTAYYVADLGWANAAGPRPRAGLICQAGAEADALLGEIQPLLDVAAGAPFPIRAAKVGDLVVVSVGYEQAAQAVAGEGAASLKANAKFQQAVAQVQADAVIAVYVDGEAALELVNQGAQLAGEEAGNQWAKARDALGLAGFKQLIFTGGFDGKEWSTRGFIAAPAPRTGLLTILEGKPLSEAMLKSIPQSATWVVAGQCDLAKVIDTARGVVGGIEPQAGNMLDRGLAQANRALGFDLKRDLLEGFGSEWTMYSDRGAAGSGLIGVVVMNRLDQPAEVERTLTKLEGWVNQKLAAEMRGEEMKLGFTQAKLGQLDVHTFSVPMVAPSWTIVDGKFYLGLYPQVTVAAAENSAKGKSLLDNPEFAALRKRLGGEKAGSFVFVDLPKTAPDAYSMLLPLSQLLLGVSDMFGVQPPRLILPPLNRLQEHLAPAAAFSWADEAGWHLRGLSPFPGSGMLAADSNVSIASSATMVSILLPALNAAKERANRVKCASNLRQIGLGVMLYANDHKGKYPPNLGTLVIETDLNPEVFMCPTADSALPQAIRGAKVEDQAAWVSANADYVYVGAAMNSGMPAEKILAYEKIENHEQEGINILFNDGHVEWVTMPQARALIRQAGGAAR